MSERGMNPLAAEIAAMIAQDGPMSVESYMGLCLAHPVHGYYMTRDPLGADGDFVTSPEISQMFGELLGLWAAETWRLIGGPQPARLVELGPGRGTLMADALRAARAAPDFSPRCRRASNGCWRAPSARSTGRKASSRYRPGRRSFSPTNSSMRCRRAIT